GVLVLLAAVGGAGEQRLVFDKALAEKTAARQSRLLAALLESASQRGIKPTGDLKGLVKLLDGDTAVREPAARLPGGWGVEAARAKLTTLARDDRARTATRRAVIDGLGSLR